MRRDAALGLALFAIAVAELLLREEAGLALQIAVSAVLAASLLLRQRHLPLAIAAQFCAFSALGIAQAQPAAVGAIPPMLICLYSAGATMPLLHGALALVAMASGTFVSALADEGVGDAIFVTTVFVIPPWVGGRVMGTRRRQIEELERLNADLAAERARAETLAAEAERGRIAREMHDVLSHGMSLMVLQAGAGPRLLASDAAAARDAFRSIRQTGERAREELEATLLGRVDPTADLGSLVAAVPDARLEVEGDLGGLAPGVRLAVQRIVQEALTNSVKHGGGAARVAIACDGATIEVAVRNPSGPGAGMEGSGRGLIGMRERAAAYGGTLQAGPSDDGGFEVRARIPAGSP